MDRGVEQIDGDTEYLTEALQKWPETLKGRQV